MVKNKFILSMNPNGKGWNYLVLKNYICIIKKNNVKT